ncbi:MAG: DUF6504 family protein, partial [Xanthobacteraceae bacterium]
PAQTGLAQPDHAAELAHLIDRLGARFGLRRVTRFVAQDTHIPELAVAAVGAVGAASAAVPGRSAARSGALQTRDPGGFHEPGSRISGAPRPGHAEQDSLAPTRPIRLLARPEPVEAIAEVPDGPPVRFRWRHVLHEVAHVEGPERIAMEWWRDAAGDALMRDYFRVESREGLRVWLFRAWPTDPKHSTRWYLHGMFA